jgi:phosphomevalonate kinase
MVALITALLYLHTKRRPPQARVFPLALSAHRTVQGGLGSGYDVACSTFGGLGLFTGGALPVYQRLAGTLPLSLSLERAPHPIATRGAIAQWRRWKQTCPGDWAEHLERSQHLVRQLAQTQNASTFARLMGAAATMGRDLGQRLEVWDPVNEQIARPAGAELFFKALGAGNELYAFPGSAGDPTAIEPTAEGVTWN